MTANASGIARLCDTARAEASDDPIITPEKRGWERPTGGFHVSWLLSGQASAYGTAIAITRTSRKSECRKIAVYRGVRAPLTVPKGLLVETRRHELVRLAGKRTKAPEEQIPGYYLG